MVKIYEDNAERLAKLGRISDRQVMDKENKVIKLKAMWDDIYEESLEYAEPIKEMIQLAEKLEKLGLLRGFKSRSGINFYDHYGIDGLYYGNQQKEGNIGCTVKGIAEIEDGPYGSQGLSELGSDYVTYLSTYNGWGSRPSEPWKGWYSIDRVESMLNSVSDKWEKFVHQFNTFSNEFYDYIDNLEE